MDGTTGDDARAACAAALERLAELADDALPSAERDALEAHVDACPECRARLDALREALAPPAEPPDALDDATREALLGVFRTWRAERVDR